MEPQMSVRLSSEKKGKSKPNGKKVFAHSIEINKQTNKVHWSQYREWHFPQQRIYVTNKI